MRRKATARAESAWEGMGNDGRGRLAGGTGRQRWRKKRWEMEDEEGIGDRGKQRRTMRYRR